MVLFLSSAPAQLALGSDLPTPPQSCSHSPHPRSKESDYLKNSSLEIGSLFVASVQIGLFLPYIAVFPLNTSHYHNYVLAAAPSVLACLTL